MKHLGFLIALVTALSLISACTLSGLDEPKIAFSDQGFKTTIALVELHHIRYGEFPESLDKLDFLGGWDPLYIRYVEYNRLEQGYELNVTSGFADDPPSLTYPGEFWQGLGIAKSNVKRGR